MSYHSKALFREEMNIKGFCKDFGVGRGNTFFFTQTFKQNIKDKKEAGMYWNILRTQITKIFPLFRYVCVWERQERGAWHLHALCNIPAVGSMKKFRVVLKDIIKRSNTPIGFFHVEWTFGNAKSIGNYMFKYLTKSEREPYIRYTNYSRNFLRKCSSCFMFVGGGAGAWRACCRVLDEMFPSSFKFFYDNARFDYLLACVNGVNGDTKSFFKGLENMFLFFSGVNHFGYRHKFSVQLYNYMNQCKNSYETIYPYGQLKLNLQGGYDADYRL